MRKYLVQHQGVQTDNSKVNLIDLTIMRQYTLIDHGLGSDYNPNNVYITYKTNSKKYQTILSLNTTEIRLI